MATRREAVVLLGGVLPVVVEEGSAGARVPEIERDRQNLHVNNTVSVLSFAPLGPEWPTSALNPESSSSLCQQLHQQNPSVPKPPFATPPKTRRLCFLKPDVDKIQEVQSD